MSVTEILDEIKLHQSRIDTENEKIRELTARLYNASADDWDWITVKQVCRAIDVSPATIYTRINRGELDTKRIGGKVYVRASSVKAIDD